jgi:hypothetical protein
MPALCPGRSVACHWLCIGTSCSCRDTFVEQAASPRLRPGSMVRDASSLDRLN